MRNNQPITNEEYLVPKGVTLVSKTDLNGNITECNDALQTSIEPVQRLSETFGMLD